MSTALYEADVVTLAANILGLGFPENVEAYRPNNSLFTLLDTNDESEELTVDISGQTSDLRYAVAALDAVQLAFDAASVAVDYRVRYASDYAELGREADESTFLARLSDLASATQFELEILELSAGSFRAKLKAVIRDPGTRTKLIKVGLLAGAILTAIVTPNPASIVVAVFTGADLLNEFAPKEFVLHALESKQAASLAATGPVEDPKRARIQEMHMQNQITTLNTRLDEANKRLEAAQLQWLKKQEAMVAEIQELKIQITAPAKQSV